MKILALLLVFLFVGPVHFAQSQQVSLRPDAIIGTTAETVCAVTATEIISANARRRAIVMSAPSTNTATIFIGPTNGVTTGTGIPVAAGGNLSDDTYIGAWFCIVAAATQPLRALETTR